MSSTHLHLGGLIAVGLDPTGGYLLTVSHSGRGVFTTRTWERIARDYEVVYPHDGRIPGIGPLASQMIAVTELDSDHPKRLADPAGRFELFCQSDSIEVIETQGNDAGR